MYREISLKLPTPAMIERTSLRVFQLDALWCASARAFVYISSECKMVSMPKALFMVVDDANLCQRSPALSGDMVFRTAATISVVLLAWRCLEWSDILLQLNHGFLNGSILLTWRNSFSFLRGTLPDTGVDSLLLWVDAVLALSGDRNDWSSIFSLLTSSETSSTDCSFSLSSGEAFSLSYVIMVIASLHKSSEYLITVSP